MNILALSDCHFKYSPTTPEDRENARVLLEFLHSVVGKYDLLVLTGDIFDLWYDGQHTIIKQYFPLLKCLADIHESGTRIVMLSGNHDFWFGDFLPDYLGIELYPDGFSMDADGQKLWFEHGDTHTINDLRYQLYRRIIRLNLIKNIFSLLHPELALNIGTFFSRSSRSRVENPQVRFRKTRGLSHYAQELITRGKATIVVMGHSHHPEQINLQGGTYLNCGDWINHHSYVEINAGIPLLQQYHRIDDNTATHKAAQAISNKEHA